MALQATRAPYAQNPTRSVVLLLCRVAVGVVFIAHGWSKFTDPTIQATITQFTRWQVPFPQLTAPLVGALEVIGGMCLLVGACTWVICVLLSLEMIGAIWLLHKDNGVFVGAGGWELCAALATALMALSVAGPGRFSYDCWANGGDDGSGSSRRR